MSRPEGQQRSTARLLAKYALLTLIPVLLLGAGLAVSFRNIARSRGVAEGRSEAILVAQTAVEPQLANRPLSEGLTRDEHRAMTRLVERAVKMKHVQRLRLRDLDGRIVFSDDGSGLKNHGDDDDDDEALSAAHGTTVARLTTLNGDNDDDADAGSTGAASVEVYTPLSAGRHRIGVLEVYLPYQPIASDVAAGFDALYRDLALGLAGLFIVLFVITLSVSRGLRRELAVNAFLAHHDTLTELPNRAMFVERVREALDRAGRSGRRATFAILDLDHFKDINDTLGHPSGDELLTEIGRRLNAHMRGRDTVARLGGDEFGLVLADSEDPHAALTEIAALVSSEVDVRGLPLSVAPSIGYISVNDPGITVETLMQQADVAMYAAKAQHATVIEYHPDLDTYDAADLELIAQLRHAIDDNELVLHYQPQADAKSGTIVAAEALLRWQHPVHGLLPPGRFLPMAEQTDLIERITEWVLDSVLADIKRVGELGTQLKISVNVSARSIVRADFADQVITTLKRSGVSPSQLVIEVTETALLTDPERARRVLGQLSDAGISVSIDDFGQGHTSLGYLAALPIDELKIDRSFVTDMSSDRAHAAIVQSVIELGHNLSMRVVAEGIEGADELSALRDLDCDLAQGFHIAKPMPIDALADLVGTPQVATAVTS
jgi:diguanylate cyclase